MNKILVALSVFTVSLQAMAGCVVLDYQEMKEMKADDLVAELCTARFKAKVYTKEADDSTIYGSKLSGYGSDAEVDDAYKKADSLREVSGSCTSQAARMERVLLASGIEPDVIQQRCRAAK